MKMPRRPRRLRKDPHTRSLVQETWLRVEDLVQPVFLTPGHGHAQEVVSMPGIFRHSESGVLEYVAGLQELGIRTIALFPNTPLDLKDALGSESCREDNLVARVVRTLKAQLPGLNIIADVALDPYTTHGHDGLLDRDGTRVLNDETVEVLCRQALVLAHAGVDWVAPSDMMDGRVGAIRGVLDDSGFQDTLILAYAAKYASAYYGPFREAVGSASSAGTHSLDKKTYQMNPANRREALVEVSLDEQEGADAVMVKPAGPYLDIIRDVREHTRLPLAAYQVSGEYAQIHAAARLGWLDLPRCRMESLLSIKRAGADLILSYFSESVASELLQR